ncbi:MAG: hypothetical protein P4M12_00445 [Gammaproteobacteria bacterium]|nr:hypothetical protein [Gammaproteobacteria bacterium]
MAIKKLCQVVLITLCFFCALTSAYGTNEGGESIQINTQLHKLYGHPSWLLILRDEESQRVFPYQFDFSQRDNFWLIFSHARSYRVTVSQLSFGPYAEIKNFCCLENRSLSGQSLNVTLKGVLSPVRATSQCYVQQYNNYNFTIVEHAQPSSGETIESTTTTLTTVVQKAPALFTGKLW